MIASLSFSLWEKLLGDGVNTLGFKCSFPQNTARLAFSKRGLLPYGHWPIGTTNLMLSAAIIKTQSTSAGSPSPNRTAGNLCSCPMVPNRSVDARL